MSERVAESYPPRGLSRDEAAWYTGLGLRLFDQLVDEGRMPQPLAGAKRPVWPRTMLDAAFSTLMREGTIYVIQALADSPVKIGFTGSENTAPRLAELQTGNPYPLRVLVTARGTPDQERAAHAALAADRLTGEWFAWSPRVALFVAAMPKGIVAAMEAVRA